MKINARKHQDYISRLSPQMPLNATVNRPFVKNFVGGGGADPPPEGGALCASHRALRAIMAGIVLLIRI